MEQQELSQHDREILSRIFEMVGYCEVVIGIRAKTDAHRAENKYLGRLLEQITFHIGQISRELNEFAKEWGYE